MDLIAQFADIILHLDVHLNNLISFFGPWIYVILFLIIFCETGLVVMPFLPGDSLLFALGALASTVDAQIHLIPLFMVLFIAAVMGDATNYFIGQRFGTRIFYKDTGIWMNKANLIKTQRFYERHGGKTIIIARFAPILRTFAPFVAGIGNMNYSRFGTYNIVGGFLWVGSFLVAGFLFGNIPAIKHNFHIVIIAIIIVSLLPAVFEIIKSKKTEN